MINKIFLPYLLMLTLFIVTMTSIYLVAYSIIAMLCHWYDGKFWFGVQQGWASLLVPIYRQPLWHAYKTKLAMTLELP